jgi:hypothetical protein
MIVVFCRRAIAAFHQIESLASTPEAPVADDSLKAASAFIFTHP